MHLPQTTLRHAVVIALFALGSCKPADKSSGGPSPVGNGGGSTLGAGNGGGSTLGAGTGGGFVQQMQPGLSPVNPGMVNPAGAVSSFAIVCADGRRLNGNYNSNADMCVALQSMTNVCAEAGTFYQGNCGATQVTGPQVTPSPQGGTGSTSFNVNCANGSNYNGSYGTHASMCSHLADKIANCAEAGTLYNRECR